MFLTDKQIASRYDVSRPTVWRWLKVDPSFPHPVRLSPGCVRWRLTDIEKWEAEKAGAAA
ncbi:AlpA family phage regulatory protein [Rhodobacter sp. SGA-6-6]|uniref:helix-turn-helix transcriptional regulator n=1 Tax=Rhodobacter sp. SGA-6-6 TaxID=2710882 RepID=UPI0013EBC2BD|nr:AlpA family phage regulatory protein [Rhodobacter sp. SGA-6-6]NGM45165.1 AlpA family phage regulatory protein [Rhodobacter sp. SGA-6-6]